MLHHCRRVYSHSSLFLLYSEFNEHPSSSHSHFPHCSQHWLLLPFLPSSLSSLLTPLSLSTSSHKGPWVLIVLFVICYTEYWCFHALNFCVGAWLLEFWLSLRNLQKNLDKNFVLLLYLSQSQERDADCLEQITAVQGVWYNLKGYFVHNGNKLMQPWATLLNFLSNYWLWEIFISNAEKNVEIPTRQTFTWFYHFWESLILMY